LDGEELQDIILTNIKTLLVWKLKQSKELEKKWDLDNFVVMIPFCRTIEELLKVYKVMESYGLKRGEKGLEVYLMAELPSNIFMAEEFSEHIDGFSIGSNDLTQLILGIRPRFSACRLNLR
jgi:pyruvate, water dikinase